MRRHIAAFAVTASVAVAGCSDRTATPTSPRHATFHAARPVAPPSPNVTSTVFDTDASGASLLTRSDGFNGSGFATYAAVDKITSHISPDGSWKLYLGSQTARRLYLVLAGQGIPVPDGYYSSNIEAYSQCFDENTVQVSILSMTAGASNGNCSFGVDFSSGGTKYKLVMSPKFAGTGRASVTCNAAAGGSCTSWTIAPNAGVVNAGVANLYRFGKNGGLVLNGTYHNSYSVGAAL
jgi:hypothetical protein